MTSHGRSPSDRVSLIGGRVIALISINGSIEI
jgi:hypothetical protein